jgi:hypothetical protein
MKNYHRRNSIDGQFSARTIEMLKSPAYRALSLTARRILDRIEIEHARHGGHDNGRLPVTFDQLVEYGARRHSIASAFRELVALGFTEITQHGRAGNAEWRRPTLFRLTYRDTDDAAVTNEWRSITEDDATMIAKGARRQGSNFARKSAHNGNRKTRHEKQNPSVQNDTIGQCRNGTIGQCRNDTEPPEFLSAETALLSRCSPSIEPQAPPPKPSPPSEPPDPWAVLDIPNFLRRY